MRSLRPTSVLCEDCLRDLVLHFGMNTGNVERNAALPVATM